jgi:hypothetical protein
LLQETAKIEIETLLESVKEYLVPQKAHWFDESYARKLVEGAWQRFDEAFERWRNLYRSTNQQLNQAHKINTSPTATLQQKKAAQKLYSDASMQMGLLTSTKSRNSTSADFYIYRYLASQGLLPGYNFPRLPLLAWIPSTTPDNDDATTVSRSRFLALSEFGPRSLIYHQGKMFRVVKAKLNASTAIAMDDGSTQLTTANTIICENCGYGNLIGANDNSPERCPCCGELLNENMRINSLYRIETVETRLVQRISMNDEERQRLGFDMQTSYVFNGNDSRFYSSSNIILDEEKLGELLYAQAATVYKINKGWKRRANKQLLGFFINPITGMWSKAEGEEVEEEGKGDVPVTVQTKSQRIVPFVEDCKNILVFHPQGELSRKTMVTLQAALKRGIEQVFQIEESELAVEPLPSNENRKRILFYEAVEGGAGVLNRLVDEPEALALVANEALLIMHYKKRIGPWDADDLLEENDPDGNAPCEAGCYRCLLSYYNQPDQMDIDRHDMDTLRILVALANGKVCKQDDSDQIPFDSLENEFRQTLKKKGYKPPDSVNIQLKDGTLVPAYYKNSRVAVFFEPANQTTIQYFTDRGMSVLVAGSDENSWDTLCKQYPDVFSE